MRSSIRTRRVAMVAAGVFLLATLAFGVVSGNTVVLVASGVGLVAVCYALGLLAREEALLALDVDPPVDVKLVRASDASEIPVDCVLVEVADGIAYWNALVTDQQVGDVRTGRAHLYVGQIPPQTHISLAARP